MSENTRRSPPGGGDATRQTALPRGPSPDEQATGAVADLGAVAELKAALATPGMGDHRTLPFYAVPDQVVVGRGTACDWQLDDGSLSRKHAQFRWNGRELTVEDLGSANGTRVNGRPVRGPTPVRHGDTIQLGTVIISFELRQSPLHTPDEQATRIVQAPDAPGDDAPSDPGPLHAAPTVVRPAPERPHAPHEAPAAGRPSAQAVFRPERDAARPDEPTRPFDPQLALQRAPERALDPEWVDRIKRAFREKRRTFVLAGAAAWMAILLIVWASLDKPAPEPDALPPPPPPAVHTGPIVTQLAPSPPPAPSPAPALPGEDREAELADAVAAYDQGRMPDALAMFRRLAASDPKDETARFMVDLITARSEKGAPP